MVPTDYEPVASIAAMARKILAAAGESSNYELDRQARQKLGGNGPIMANALASLLASEVTYIGATSATPPFTRSFHDFAAPGPGHQRSPSPATPTPWSSPTAS